MNDAIRSVFQILPGLFSILCVTATHLFSGWTRSSCFQRKILDRDWSQMLCGTPAGCFALPVQQKTNLILQSGHSLLLISLFWHRRDFFACEKERSQSPPFLRCFLLINFTTVLPWLQLTPCSFKEKWWVFSPLCLFSCFSGNHLNGSEKVVKSFKRTPVLPAQRKKISCKLARPFTAAP